MGREELSEVVERRGGAEGFKVGERMRRVQVRR